MFHVIPSCGRPTHRRDTKLPLGMGGIGCCCIIAAAIACLGLSGCTTLDHSNLDFSQVDNFDRDPPPRWSQEFRLRDSGPLPHAVTNKGMQIERSLGVR